MTYSMHRRVSILALILTVAITVPVVARADVAETTPSPRRASWGSARVRETFPVAALSEGRFVIVSAEVTVRAAPRPNARVLAYLYRGDRLTLVQQLSYAWSKVRLPNGSEGYVYTDAIAVVRPTRVILPRVSTVSTSSRVEEPDAPKTSATGTHRVTSPILRLRMDARATSFELAVLHAGDTVTVHAILPNGWARVDTAKGSGYVFAQFLTPVE